MPIPIAVALATSAAAPIIGSGISRLVGGRRKIPDLLQPVVNESQQAAADLQTQQNLQLKQAEERAARSGANVSGAQENIINANARQDALLRASILDTIANARKQQEIVEADAKNQERAELMQGIQSGFNAVGSGFGALAGLPSGAGSAAGVTGGTSAVTASTPVALQAAQSPTVPLAATNFDPNTIQAVQPAGFETLPVTANLPTQLAFIPSAADLSQRSFVNMQS